MSVRWHTYPDPKSAAEACAHHIIGILEEALSGQDCASAAFSGGHTAASLFQALAASDFRWDRVHLFWVDERCVPPNSLQSNYGLAERELIGPAHIPLRQVHRIGGELLAEHAARRYADDIREFFGLEDGEMPHFDVVHRGMGADAHTASLFPGDPLIDDREGIAGATYVKKMSQWRVTLLPGPLVAAKHTVFLVTGEEKAQAVRDVFGEEYDPKRFPAQISSHHARRVAWFLDEAAASLMDSV